MARACQKKTPFFSQSFKAVHTVQFSTYASSELQERQAYKIQEHTMKKKLILASSSKYRKVLLEKLFRTLKCDAPMIDERAIVAPTPRELAIKLGELKAKAIADKHTLNSIIIASDQVAMLDGKQLHKPGDRDSNRKQLEECSGKQVHFFTSVCLLEPESGKVLFDCDATVVTFKHLSNREIENYVEREPAYDCAGGFKVEGLGIALFESIETEDPNALMGLPLIKLCRLLEEFGISPLNYS